MTRLGRKDFLQRAFDERHLWAFLRPPCPAHLAFPDILPFPLLSRHRLSADLLALLYLHAVDEHAEVLADRDQRRVLVVKLHAQRSVHRLRDFGNRGGRLVAGPAPAGLMSCANVMVAM